jgi:hypothetical protein
VERRACLGERLRTVLTPHRANARAGDHILPRRQTVATDHRSIVTSRPATPSTQSRSTARVYDERTRPYLTRRISDGKTKREARRALKRHLSRNLHNDSFTAPLPSRSIRLREAVARPSQRSCGAQLQVTRSAAPPDVGGYQEPQALVLASNRARGARG